jgi:hypothetical protein
MPTPVVVTSTAGVFTAAGALGSFFVLLGLVVRQVTPWRKQSIDAEQEKRKEGRSDLSDCKERLDRMAARMDGLYEVVNNLKIELAGVLSAYRVLEVAEDLRDPFSVHLAQARAILTTAFTVGPSTSGVPHKSETLRAAEETCHAAEMTVANVKRDERDNSIPKDEK